MRILIVEDEIRLSETLRDILAGEMYLVDICSDGADGLDNALSGIYDAVIVDVMLPGMNGFKLVGSMREAGCSTPAMMLTARSSLEDKVTGLDCGADYYLTKPFEVDELLACLRTITRRTAEIKPDVLSFGDIKMNASACCLSCGERSVRLGAREAELMRLLLLYGENNVPKETMFLKAWGYDSDADTSQVEVYVSFLRKKLKVLGSGVQIRALVRVGYHLERVDNAK